MVVLYKKTISLVVTHVTFFAKTILRSFVYFVQNECRADSSRFFLLVISGKRGISVETLNDRSRLERYMETFGIRQLFGGKTPDFLLLHYAPGDLLTTPFSPSKYMQFIVAGDLLLYDMPDENSSVMLRTDFNDVKLLGEMELLNSRFDPFFVEARSDVYTLAIHLDQYRTQLLNDPVFLRYICHTLSDKLAGAVRSTFNVPLKTRVSASLRFAEPGQTFCGIADIAKQIGVSNRQLLRVLKELCDEGILVHEKKGVYRIVKKPGE